MWQVNLPHSVLFNGKRRTRAISTALTTVEKNAGNEQSPHRKRADVGLRFRHREDRQDREDADECIRAMEKISAQSAGRSRLHDGNVEHHQDQDGESSSGEVEGALGERMEKEEGDDGVRYSDERAERRADPEEDANHGNGSLSKITAGSPKTHVPWCLEAEITINEFRRLPPIEKRHERRAAKFGS